MEPKVSICLIVKNEESYIENCLKSVLPVAYEIIIADTGSKDKTKEICLAVGEAFKPSSTNASIIKIIETEWKNDYSIVRNESIKHATGDWILVIDADELLTEYTQDNLIPFLRDYQDMDKPIAFRIRVLEPSGNVLNYVYKTVLFKNGYNISFTRPLHEYICRKEDDLFVYKADFLTLFHSRNINNSSEELKKKTDRYIFNILKIIKENPDPADNYFYYYHLGNTYMTKGQFNMALKAYQDSYTLYREKFGNENSVKEDFFYESILTGIINTLCFYKKRYKDAIPYIEELLNIFPDLPEGLFYLGYCYEYLSDLTKAIEIYEKTVLLLKSKTYAIPLDATSVERKLLSSVFQELARCYLVLKNEKKALEYFKSAFKINSKSTELSMLISLFYFLDEHLEGVLNFYTNNRTFSDDEKKYFYDIAKLPSYDIRYKSTLLTLLKSLENIKIDWLGGELKLIRKKISELESYVSELSIFIITANNENTIVNCLKSVLPLSSDILVFDTGSTDRTKEIASGFAKVLISKNDVNENYLKNYLFQFCKGKWVLFLSGDEELSPDTQANLKNYLRFQPHQNKPVALKLKYIQRNSSEKNLKTSLIRTGYNIQFFADGNVFCPIDKMFIDTTNFSVFKNK